MSETTETHYCHYHPNIPTSLRCNKCGKYICIKDACRTPVGYRCKECVRGQQDVFFTATPVDYVMSAVISLPLAFIAAQYRAAPGFHLDLRRANRGHRHRRSGAAAPRANGAAATLAGGVLLVWSRHRLPAAAAVPEILLLGGCAGIRRRRVPLSLGFIAIYLVLAAGTSGQPIAIWMEEHAALN